MATNPKIVFTGEDRVSGVVKGIGRDLEGLNRRIGLVSSAFGLGFASISTAGAVLAIKNMIGSLDDLDEAAQGIGVTAVALADLRLAASESGVGAEKLDAALGKLNVKISDAASGNKTAIRLFKDLGVAYKDAAGNARTTEEVLRDVAKAFSTSADGAGKSALAIEAFGRTGAGLVAYLNQGSDGLRKFAGVTEENVEHSRRLQGQLDKLGASYDRLKLSLGGTIAGGINDVIERAGRQDNARQVEVLTKRFEQLRAELTTQRNPEFLQAINIELAETEKRLAALKAAGIDRFLQGAAAARRADRPQLVKSDDGADEEAKRRAEQARKEAERNLQIGEDARREDQAFWRAHEKELEGIRDRMRQGVNRIALEDAEAREEFRRESLRAVAEDADRSAARARAVVENFNKEAERANEIWKDLGLTFSSAFEDAIVGGGSLRDVLKGLEADILRITTRKLITEPLANYIGGIDYSKIFGAIAGSFAGGMAEGGYIQPGKYALVGERGPELAFGGRSGQTITPMFGGRGGPTSAPISSQRAIVVNNTFVLPPDGVTRATQSQIAVKAGMAISNAARRGF